MAWGPLKKKDVPNLPFHFTQSRSHIEPWCSHPRVQAWRAFRKQPQSPFLRLQRGVQREGSNSKWGAPAEAMPLTGSAADLGSLGAVAGDKRGKSGGSRPGQDRPLQRPRSVVSPWSPADHSSQPISKSQEAGGWFVSLTLALALPLRG